MNTQEIRYPTIETAIRANQIGGEDGSVRDMNGLGSALAAPRNAAIYEGADLVNLAALFIQRTAMNHPFIDGNKRTAFILGSMFLMINGYQLAYQDKADEMSLAYTIENMIKERSFDDLVAWIKAHITTFTGQANDEQIMQQLATQHPEIVEYLGTH